MGDMGLHGQGGPNGGGSIQGLLRVEVTSLQTAAAGDFGKAKSTLQEALLVESRDFGGVASTSRAVVPSGRHRKKWSAPDRYTCTLGKGVHQA